MYCLGIETSCDETAAAVTGPDGSGAPAVLAERISSQSKTHEEYGGVVPELASREHLYNLPLVVNEVLERSGKNPREIDLIAVTRGPGLKGCLLMGLNFAKGLSLAWEKPMIGVNHIEGHIISAVLDNPEIKFPFLSLVVSGGHTEIVIVRGVADYELVARTIDDAAGEAFDKSASLLGIPYPGGPQLAAIADRAGGSEFKLPKVMREAEGFSFSGLKTAISLLVRANKEKLDSGDGAVLGSLAWAIQDSIVDSLIYKLTRAVQKTGIKTVTLAGGVSANRELRRRVSEIKGVKAFFTRMEHCMDNAAMIAYLGALRFGQGETTPIDCDAEARWPVEAMNRKAVHER